MVKSESILLNHAYGPHTEITLVILAVILAIKHVCLRVNSKSSFNESSYM